MNRKPVRLSIACAVLAAIIDTACASPPPPAGLESLRPPPGVIVQENVDTFVVTGSNRAEIRAQLFQLTDSRGQRFAGMHKWNFTWRYETKSDRSSCRVQRTFTHVTSTVTLPAWAPSPGADTALVSEWARYRTALATHERGHREIAFAAAGRIVRTMQTASEPTCTLLSNRVRARNDSLTAAANAASAQYDADTQHGRTQGAVLR